MGQKVNPHGLRVGIIRNWDSRWFARDDKFGDILVQDNKIRKYIKKEMYGAGIPKIEIERNSADRIKIYIQCARPGIVTGKGGQEIEKLRKNIEKMVGQRVYITIVEVKRPELNAQLVAERIASDLEKRTAFRRATRTAIDRTMKMGAKGIKTMVSGRLAGAEIARSEHFYEGTIPLQTLRADIDYGFAEAHTTYGRIGVKVWIYKGEVLASNRKTEVKEDNRRVNAKKNKI
ncbi:MAG: 30S ribosomal protein S3 [Clostridia bacterium]|nr:30S ribosomal protein S3 [Clostridia bacterium]MBO5298716.1 30S ribosomal protein S3 [Clostridia bacterium]MBQ4628084.1 30S ribosomal protein S3 [Clostridia bacterium]